VFRDASEKRFASSAPFAPTHDDSVGHELRCDGDNSIGWVAVFESFLHRRPVLLENIGGDIDALRDLRFVQVVFGRQVCLSFDEPWLLFQLRDVENDDTKVLG